MPDAIFSDPRLAVLYDVFECRRDDLDAYLGIADELGARSVLDVGCGTGVLACALAARGISVTGVDPAAASVEVARGKRGSERVSWMVGDATTLPPLAVDLAVMTGNVAQVFLTDEAWSATLLGVREALRPGGHLVFETRVPEREAWRSWTPDQSLERVEVPGTGPVTHWVELTDVRPPFVSFRWTFRFDTTGEELTSDSTLRFRSLAEIDASLAMAGFERRELRDAPDRPGLELVVVAQRLA